MLKLWISLLFSLSIATFGTSYDNILNCSPDNPHYFLSNNTFSLLQSLQFPQSIDRGGCQTKLQTVFNGTVIWIAMLNGAIDIYGDDGTTNNWLRQDYTSNFDILTFTTTSNLLNFGADQLNDKWSAFQAVAVTFDPLTINSSCPISGRTFNFLSSQPDIVVPLSSSFQYPPTDYPDKNCFWSFKVDSKQMLKINVKQVNANHRRSLVIYADGIIVQNFTQDIDNKVFYFNGTTFNVKFSPQNSQYSFFMLVSAVDPPPSSLSEYTSDGCSLKPNVFSNFDKNNGYPSYQYCNNSVTNICQGCEATLTILSNNYYESCCDKLSFIGSDGSTTALELTEDTQTYTLTKDANESEIQFISDGNTESAGYSVTIQSYRCECSNQVIQMSCYNNSQNFSPMMSSDTYCSNLNCKYQLLPNSGCPDFNVGISVKGKLRSQDTLLISYNGTQTEIYDKYSGFFPANSNISFAFVSGSADQVISASDKKYWSIGILTYSIPKFYDIVLNETNSKLIFMLREMNQNDAYSICSSTSQNLQIFVSSFTESNYLEQFKLYNGSHDVTNFFGTLASFSLRESKCFTIFRPSVVGMDYSHAYVFFKIKDDENCKEENTVFSNPDDTSVSQSSNENGSCEIILLSSGNYSSYPIIWITVISVDSQLPLSFINTINRKPLFTLNASDFSESDPRYNDGIHSMAISIIIPQSSSIYAYYDFPSDNVILIDDNHFPKGYFTSPDYDGFQQNFNGTNLYQTLNYSKMPVKTTFVIKEIDPNTSVKIKTDMGDVFELVNTTTTITSYDFSVNYEHSGSKTSGFLIEYSMEEGVLTSLPPTSTSENDFTSPSFEYTSPLFGNNTYTITTPWAPPTPPTPSSTYSLKCEISVSVLILSFIFAFLF